MPRRLQKTAADYVAIAISPALIMALVGSLVFFLIELFYVGDFHARLNYVFALFVFAAVLIARISIEMGTEHAMKFGLALGFAVFVVLAKFVQHPNPFSHLVNLSLIGIVWWCAHRLTWDCTLIDEREDASGAGLMQRLGADSPGTKEQGDGGQDTSGERADPTARDRQREPGTADNQLLAADDHNAQRGVRGAHAWWKRWLGRRGPHPPGMWVLYFSMAALPIFGLGQRLIPAADTGRRRYAFALLTVYVASALALLVTTSFLGLRRYLRQRRIEMPAPIAATWVVSGGLLMVVVMLVAALLPRPHAEYAVSQVPWQVRSPEGLAPSRWSVGTDGTGENEPEENAVSRADESQQTDYAVTNDQANVAKGQFQNNEPTSSKTAKPHGDKDQPTESSRPQRESKIDPQTQRDSSPQDGPTEAKPPQEGRAQESQPHEPQSHDGESRRAQASERELERPKPPDSEPLDRQQTAAEQSSGTPPAPAASRSTPPNPLAYLSLPAAGIGAILKLLFYAIFALIIGVLVWKNRRQLLAALVDLLSQLRDLLARLLGRKATTRDDAADKSDVANQVAAPTFAQFQDPFLTGRSLAPEQLVRYTFEAFEAWARDQGIARRADQTPHELVHLAVPSQTTLSNEARRMVRLYNSLAYAGVKVPSEQAARLQTLWTLMRKTGEVKGGRRKAEGGRGG